MRAVCALRRRLTGSGGDRGALSIVFFWILLFVTLPIAAFAIDYGYAYEQRRELSTLADGAALAAAREIQLRAEPGETCESLRDTYTPFAEAAADAIKTANGPADATLEPEPGSPKMISCPETGPKYLLVTVTASKTTPAFFAPAFMETDGNQIRRTAKAVLAPAGQIRGIRPFAICEDTAKALIDEAAKASATGSGVVGVINMPLDRTADTRCTDPAVESAGKGNKSRIELDPTKTFAESLAAGSISAMTVTADGSFLLTAYTGEPWSNASITAMNGLLDTAFMMPVYKKAVKSGNNVVYEVTGFIAGRLCGWQKTPTNSNNIHKINPVTGTTCYDNNKPMTPGVDMLQIRYSHMVPAGELAACSVGGATNTPCSIEKAGFAPLLIKPFG